jgi:hypothetical protein
VTVGLRGWLNSVFHLLLVVIPSTVTSSENRYYQTVPKIKKVRSCFAKSGECAVD